MRIRPRLRLGGAISWAVCGALAGGGLVAGLVVPAKAETIRQALARTYRGSPLLSAERARQRADDENVPRALGGYDPSIALTVQGGPGYERDRPGTGSTTASPVTVGVTLNQTLYDSGQTAAAVRGAESLVFGGRATLRGVEQDVLLSAATAYMDVLRDEVLLGLQRNNVEFLRETLRVAQKRFETGDVGPTDPAQAESRLARGQADVATALANLAASQATYRQIIGVAPDRLVFPEPAEAGMPASLTAAVRTALEHHPAVRSAMHAVDGATSDVTIAAKGLSPSITAQGTVSRLFGNTLDATGSTSPTLGLQGTVPIYDGGATPAQVRQAKETLGQRRHELEIARDQVRSALRAAWGVLESARASIPAQESAVAANEVALAGVSRERAEGQRTTLDVLNAEQELVSARAALASARRDRVVASYGVLGAMGTLGAASLGLAGPRYRAETHYQQVRGLRAGTRTPDGR